ncbi:hypothetical protein ACIBEA_34970 [Streptomyces sp. NPDC051555]|uniref:hypothetical protein n=1 Tax=Streptomyces sp. NPDC051555 TaxID=3365657 RepID=UPI0037BDCC11
MQLRRAVPLSLVVLLAGTGCSSVGDGDGAQAPSSSRPAAPAADASAPPHGGRTGSSPSGAPPGPLFVVPDPAPNVRRSPGAHADTRGHTGTGTDGPALSPATPTPGADLGSGSESGSESESGSGSGEERRAGERAMQPSAPRRTSPRKPAPSHQRRYAAPPPARVSGQQEMDDLCSAADGTLPPSVVDLCVGRFGE